jgi:D-3-phosphoglycerate dehydrogenase
VAEVVRVAQARSGPRLKALVRAPFDERWLARLRKRVNVTYEPWTDSRQLYDPAKLAERLRAEKIGAIVVEADFLQEQHFAVPSVKIAGVCRNALNLVDVGAATGLGVPIIHTPSRNTTAVVELTIGLMIAVSRHLPHAHEWVRAGKWTDPIDAYIRFRGRELAGSTVGVIGLGQIGGEVAEKVAALGARVVAHDPYLPAKRAKELGLRMVSFGKLLEQADFVTLHTSLASKDAVIDGDALDLMKPEAYLISTGAGTAVDIDALAARLKSRRIAGAGLDVFPGHMLAADSPLLEMDNVVLTPHIGGATGESIERHSRMIVEDIERYLDGKRMRRVANPDALKVARRGR